MQTLVWFGLVGKFTDLQVIYSGICQEVLHQQDSKILNFTREKRLTLLRPAYLSISKDRPPNILGLGRVKVPNLFENVLLWNDSHIQKDSWSLDA